MTKRRNQKEFEYCLNEMNGYNKMLIHKRDIYKIDQESYVRMMQLLSKWGDILSNW